MPMRFPRIALFRMRPLWWSMSLQIRRYWSSMYTMPDRLFWIPRLQAVRLPLYRSLWPCLRFLHLSSTCNRYKSIIIFKNILNLPLSYFFKALAVTSVLPTRTVTIQLLVARNVVAILKVSIKAISR
jgi:hypothetical protein